jgi:hypothetical protein
VNENGGPGRNKKAVTELAGLYAPTRQPSIYKILFVSTTRINHDACGGVP